MKYLLIAPLILAVWWAFDTSDAMQKCQENGYSYDICFYKLNR